MEGPLDPAADAVLSVLGTTAAFTYGPQGTTTGLVKYTGSAIVQKYQIKTGVGGAGTFSATLQVTGAVTRGVY